ncbi:hypothetical protein HY990_06410 [Candidatus Micrarchaeota archaeon]|nr:hypothetical protein [Candidatus Micrarchaeota archaeon]
MIGERTATELAQAYLEKHTVQISRFGLANLIENGGYELMVMPDGGFFLAFNREGVYFDCRTISQTLFDDIAQTNPELRPSLRIKDDRTGIHNWVEIIDPLSGRRIQIDPTPWQATITPNHLGGKEDSPDIIVCGVSMDIGVAPPHLVTPSNVGHLTTYLEGNAPIVGRPDMRGANQDFLFIFNLRHERGWGDLIEKHQNAGILVTDSAELQRRIGSKRDLDLEPLFATGLIHFGLVRTTPKVQFVKLNIQKLLYAPGMVLPNPEAGLHLRESVLRFVPLIKRLKPRLPLLGAPTGTEIDVRNPDLAAMKAAYNEYVGKLARNRKDPGAAVPRVVR